MSARSYNYYYLYTTAIINNESGIVEIENTEKQNSCT